MRDQIQQVWWAALSMLAVITTALWVTPVEAATVVYVSNAASNDIYVLQLDPRNGDLTLLEKVAIPGVKQAGMSTPLALSPDRRFLFVATRGEPQAVFTYAIDPQSGKLNLLGSGPLVDSMPFIATDRTGRFLFAASYQGHKLTVSPLDAKGLVQAPLQILENHTNAHSILPDKQNRFVLAMTLGNDLAHVFRFDAQTGKLSPHSTATLKAKTGPRHFVFHPNGKLVYLLGELDATVHVFAWDAANGQLKEKQSVSALLPGTTGRIAAADMHLTPDGKFLYASERTANSLAGFKVNPADGTLALIEIVPTETQPRGFGIDPTSRFLFVAGQRSNRLSSYQIAPATGKLTKLKEYPLGNGPNWVEIVELPAK